MLSEVWEAGWRPGPCPTVSTVGCSTFWALFLTSSFLPLLPPPQSQSRGLAGLLALSSWAKFSDADWHWLRLQLDTPGMGRGHLLDNLTFEQHLCSHLASVVVSNSRVH